MYNHDVAKEATESRFDTADEVILCSSSQNYFQKYLWICRSQERSRSKSPFLSSSFSQETLKKHDSLLVKQLLSYVSHKTALLLS